MNNMNLAEKLALALVTGFVMAVIGVFVARHEKAGPFLPAPPPVVKLQIVYVGSKRCVWCGKMERDTLSNEKVAARLLDYTFIKTAGRDADERYKVKKYPTYLILTPDGKEVSRGVGYRAPDEFIAWLDGKDVRDLTESSPVEK